MSRCLTPTLVAPALSLLAIDSSVARAGVSSSESAPPAHYDLVVDVLPESHSIRVTGSWTIPAEDLTENAGPGSRKIQFWSSEKLLDLRLDYRGVPLRITCAPKDGQLACDASIPGRRQETYRLHVAYRSDGKPVAQLRIDSDQAFAGSSGDYWYPQLLAVQRATARIRFHAPRTFTVIAPGSQTARIVHGDTTTTDFRIDVPVNLGFAAAPYQIYGGELCSLYLLQENPAGTEIAAHCARIANALTHIWGAFPRGDVKIVEVDFKSALLGVGEAGYILVDTSELHREFELNYWAHELSHQWWGSSIHAKYPSPGNSLLTEGMAEFGALSVNRELGGKQGENDYLSDRLAHEPAGAPLAHYLTVLARHEDTALTSLPTGEDGTRLHYVVTSKGVLAIDMLSRTVGPAFFQRTASDFLRLRANQEVTWRAFEEFIDQRTGRDLSWFYSQWFDRPGVPFIYAVWAPAGDGIDVTLHQCGTSYRFDGLPLQVRYAAAGGSYETRIVEADFQGAKSTAHLAGIHGVYRVNPDPDHAFLWLPGQCD